jgi:hypothetical protein
MLTASAMPIAPDQDLLILARERVVVQGFGGTAGSVEIRLDTRRMERRRVPESAGSEERRQRDRRALDVSEQLRTVGWAFISAAHRRAITPVEAVGPVRRSTAPVDPSDAVKDEAVIERRLAGAVLCAPCIATITGIPLHRVERSLERLQSATKLRMLGARCDECRKTTLVYALEER